jgi:hypothetical protein
VPFVSTDTARFRLANHSGQNRFKYTFSDYFTIRPDPRLGDAAPSVTMTSPSGGESFPGGGVVPIVWTATDDEGLRAVDIQVSTDGGRVWQYIAEDLPGTTTSFDWQLPPSAGLGDVRVRVMVSDLRFQTSSSGGNVTFSVTPGSGGCIQPPGEVSGVVVDSDKITLQWAPGEPGDTYDVARGIVGSLAGGDSAICILTGTTELQYEDFDTPTSGEAYYYLLRATNACGAGSWGDTSGAQRQVACP